MVPIEAECSDDIYYVFGADTTFVLRGRNDRYQGCEAFTLIGECYLEAISGCTPEEDSEGWDRFFYFRGPDPWYAHHGPLMKITRRIALV